MTTRGRIGLGLAIVALVLAGVIAADRRPLRAAEQSYLDGRNVTACATRELRPFAEEARDLEELPEALEQVILDARQDARPCTARAS